MFKKVKTLISTASAALAMLLLTVQAYAAPADDTTYTNDVKSLVQKLTNDLFIVEFTVGPLVIGAIGLMWHWSQDDQSAAQKKKWFWRSVWGVAISISGTVLFNMFKSSFGL